VLLERPAVAVITSGCRAACVSVTSKKFASLTSLRLALLRCQSERQPSLQSGGLPPSARTTLFHPGTLSDKRSRLQMTPTPSSPIFPQNYRACSRAHRNFVPPPPPPCPPSHG
jgi:hypothetical protein